jgi:hypothetical protein
MTIAAGAVAIIILALLGPNIGDVEFTCTMQLQSIQARVVDDQTGEPIMGAYWRSQVVGEGVIQKLTGGGPIIQELSEGWTDADRPYLVADDSLIWGRNSVLESGTEDTVRILVVHPISCTNLMCDNCGLPIHASQ